MTSVDGKVEVALDEVERIGDLAHRILRSRALDQRDRERALVSLLATAKRSSVPSLAAEAILRQLDASIDGTLHEPPRPVGDGWARRQRAMRALGHVRCPTCASTIADEIELERLEGWSS